MSATRRWRVVSVFAPHTMGCFLPARRSGACDEPFGSRDPRCRTRCDGGLAVRDFNDRVHGRLRALLHERREHITHADPAFAVNLGLFVASAAAREAVLADNLRACPIKVTDDVLIAERTRAWVAYLQPTTRAAGRRR